MGTTGFFLLFLLGTIIYGIYMYARAEHKTGDATQTLLFIVVYPFLPFIAVANKPVALWIAVPLVMMIIPWLFAGIHLSKVVKDPSATRQNEFAGMPIVGWAVGFGLSVGIGLLFA